MYYRFKILLIGLNIAAEYLQRVKSKINDVIVYFYNNLVARETIEEHNQLVDKVIKNKKT